jgi:hypothetical protein
MRLTPKLLPLLLLACAPATAARRSPATDWRDNIRTFAEAHLQHTA